MSRFLGPIHHWLFNKIIMFEEIEKNIIVNSVENLGIDRNELEEVIMEFPKAIGNKSLEAIIDTDNIHGWLQNKISIAEARQAKLITYLVEKCPVEGKELALNVYSLAGKAWGEEAKANNDVSNAPSIFKVLNNYVLEGMPCDNVNNVIATEMDLLSWEVTRCLHKEYWIQVSGDENLMYELRAALLTGFVKGANEKYNYVFSKDNGTLSHKISL